MAAVPQNPQQAIDVMSSVTLTHVALMLALALAAILIIWWGAVLRHRRKVAQQQVEHDFKVAEEKGATAAPAESVDAEGVATPSADVPQPARGSAAVPSPVPAGGNAIATDLTQIKGLGPKLAATLAERGITRVDQLAALGPDEAAALDAQLGTFSGRMARDRWVEQATLLSAGDRAGYEAAFGKLGG